ncbi:M42 family metallopeptidase [Desulforhabdus amnigena]|jgi:endoglucanase|uniref:Peptidase M28 n=1 Tax=Desulforhabdus amnigena TaxID=40218 RepID=A0A9W6D108_9BACT|nr:M42 family metallopeptidase [Desulforhabdus amnigena]GLI34102.1 peptidase M28 [Desulforhabdus amnigena]
MEVQKRKATALQLLKKLGEAHGAPGCENAVRRIFRQELDGSVRTDKSGNIIQEKEGLKVNPRIMLTAHMDEVGFAVQSITKAGMIKMVPLGGWWTHTLLAQRVRILTQEGREVLGVVGAKPPHFLSEAEREKVMKLDDMFVDVGALNAEDVRDRFGISPGDVVVPESPFTPMHNPDFLLCKAFDNRAGMALTIQAMQMLKKIAHPNTILAVGTVQEEVGVRGARTAAFGVNPDAAIVLEGTPADDLPGFSDEERQGQLGKGVQIRIMDPSAIMNRRFVQFAVQVAETNKVRYQLAVRKSGGTDARVIHLNGTGVPTIVLGVPARYIHTHNAVIHMEDYLSALELVLQLAESLDAATVESFTAFND